MHANRVRRDGGFSLVELVVVSVILVTLSLSLLAVFSSSQVAVAEMNAGAVADAQLLRVIDRLHDELDFADLERVTLVDSRTLRFSVVEGWVGYAPLHGPERVISLASDELSIDGQVIVDGLIDPEMTLDGNRLEIEFTAQGEYLHNGAVEPVARRSVIVHRFENGTQP